MYDCTYLYRMSQEQCASLRESVLYVKVYRYNPKHLYPKLNGYGDNGQRKEWSSCGPTYCTCSADLNESFPNRWLGRGGPVAWPPRSPDLTPLDYYLWGHMKTLVYETKVESTAALSNTKGTINLLPSTPHHTTHSQKISFESGLHMLHVDYHGTTYAHFVNYLYRPG